MNWYKTTLVGWLGLASLFAGQSAASTTDKQQLQNKLESMTSYSASFEQQVIDAEGEVLQQMQGQVRLRQPQQLYWEVFEPNENILIADGQTLWQIDPFVEQVIALDQQSAVASNPIVLLTSKAANDWQQFNVSKANGAWLVEATDDASPIQLLTLFFTDNKLTGLALTDTQGQLSQFVFNDIRQNTPLADDLFQFSLPAGYELDDQRN